MDPESHASPEFWGEHQSKLKRRDAVVQRNSRRSAVRSLGSFSGEAVQRWQCHIMPLRHAVPDAYAARQQSVHLMFKQTALFHHCDWHMNLHHWAKRNIFFADCF